MLDSGWFCLGSSFRRTTSEKRAKKDRVPYDTWERQGLFNLTPGKRNSDTQFILEKIRELAEVYQITEICFDRAFSADIVPQLESSGLTAVNINQGEVAMTPPCKRLPRNGPPHRDYAPG